MILVVVVVVVVVVIVVVVVVLVVVVVVTDGGSGLSLVTFEQGCRTCTFAIGEAEKYDKKCSNVDPKMR